MVRARSSFGDVPRPSGTPAALEGPKVKNPWANPRLSELWHHKAGNSNWPFTCQLWRKRPVQLGQSRGINYVEGPETSLSVTLKTVQTSRLLFMVNIYSSVLVQCDNCEISEYIDYTSFLDGTLTSGSYFCSFGYLVQRRPGIWRLWDFLGLIWAQLWCN